MTWTHVKLESNCSVNPNMVYSQFWEARVVLYSDAAPYLGEKDSNL